MAQFRTANEIVDGFRPPPDAAKVDPFTRSDLQDLRSRKGGDVLKEAAEYVLAQRRVVRRANLATMSFQHRSLPLTEQKPLDYFPDYEARPENPFARFFVRIRQNVRGFYFAVRALRLRPTTAVDRLVLESKRTPNGADRPDAFKDARRTAYLALGGYAADHERQGAAEVARHVPIAHAAEGVLGAAEIAADATAAFYGFKLLVSGLDTVNYMNARGFDQVVRKRDKEHRQVHAALEDFLDTASGQAWLRDDAPQTPYPAGSWESVDALSEAIIAGVSDRKSAELAVWSRGGPASEAALNLSIGPSVG